MIILIKITLYYTNYVNNKAIYYYFKSIKDFSFNHINNI